MTCYLAVIARNRPHPHFDTFPEVVDHCSREGQTPALIGGTRTHNLRLRKPMPHPSGHGGHALTVAPVLTTPIFDGVTPSILQCDASAEACAACLAQRQPDESEKPIAYASMKLSDSQRKWSVIERAGYTAPHVWKHITLPARLQPPRLLECALEQRTKSFTHIIRS